MSEPRFVFVCQVVEVIREVNANDTSGDDGLALIGSFGGESKIIIPKLEPDIVIFSNRVLLVYAELEYHAEWCALKYPNIWVSLLYTHSLASEWSPMFLFVVHQPASPSIWPAVQSLRRGQLPLDNPRTVRSMLSGFLIITFNIIISNNM